MSKKNINKTERQAMIAARVDSLTTDSLTTDDQASVIDAKWRGKWYPASLISLTGDGK